MSSTRKPIAPFADRLAELLESIPGVKLDKLPAEAKAKFSRLYTDLSVIDERANSRRGP